MFFFSFLMDQNFPIFLVLISKLVISAGVDLPLTTFARFPLALLCLRPWLLFILFLGFI